MTKDDTDIPRDLLGPKYRAGEQASEATKLKSLQTREQVPPDPFSHTGSKGLGKGVGRTGDQMNVSTLEARDWARESAGLMTR